MGHDASLKTRGGFSLIEVLIFVSILGIFFIIAISTTVSSLRNMKINEHKILATRYGEDLLEWLKSQKEADFNIFANYDTGGSGTTYCFNQTPIVNGPCTASGSTICLNNAPVTKDACTATGLNPAIYKRFVTLTKSGSPASSVQISITVQWDELGTTRSVPINSTLYIYE